MTHEFGIEYAKKLDAADPLGKIRARFHIPKAANGEPCIYLVGNSTGLQPKTTEAYVVEELKKWATMGADAHFEGKFPWYSYHETVTEPLARLVGAKPIEVVAMNGLSVNLQLMLSAFYSPKPQRFRVAMEANAFPSDRYAITQHARFRGVAAEPEKLILELRHDETLLPMLEKNISTLSLILIGHPNYLSGHAFPMAEICSLARRHGIPVGVDLAHGIGNLKLALHDWGVDFAIWCSYKYLNAGPGAIGGCFVHERFAQDQDRPRLAGWWGHDKVTRFKMAPKFEAMAGAEGFQLSNPPIFQLAALRASLEIFDEVGMDAILEKSQQLTGYLEYLVDKIPGAPLKLITPREPKQRGAQLSWQLRGGDTKAVVDKLKAQGVFCDFREPDVLRVAPVALYNTFSEMHQFVEFLNHATRS